MAPINLDNVELYGKIDFDETKYPSHSNVHTVLTKECLKFIVLLHRTFNAKRLELLKNRDILQEKIDSDPSKLVEIFTSNQIPKIRENSDLWSGPTALGPGLQNRHVEITGPPVRNMLVNALNTEAADAYMVDFEDSSSPTWENMINGQVNLYDAIRNQIDFNNGKKDYKLNDDFVKLNTVMVRPRGWHMDEKHLKIDNEYISASIFDFGVYFYNNAQKLIELGKGPYFYLPKMEHHLEAKLWNDIFNVSQDYLNIPRGTVRATVLIETLPAAFQLDEIVYQLRTHMAGLNCGRWDYIFSTIKKLRNLPDHILPNRDLVTMGVPFMSNYASQLPTVCHKYGISAIGGMAATIPIKDDPVKNETAMKKVVDDKQRELSKGFDGSWSATPVLCSVVKSVFDKLGTPNQIHYIPDTAHITSLDLLNTDIDGFKITTDGIRLNLDIGLQYMEAWVRGNGCVAIHNLMEDAATAEVSAKMLFQWVKHKVELSDKPGQYVTPDLTLQILKEETARLIKENEHRENKFELVAQYFEPEITGAKFSDFITTMLYDEVITPTETPFDLSLLK
ncbi:malate synthase dal7 [Hanseniaspora vineae]